MCTYYIRQIIFIYKMSLKGSPIRRLQLFNKETTTEAAVLTAENQKLSNAVYAKNLQIKSLLDENKTMKLNYEEQISSYEKTIGLLQKQLKQVQFSRSSEFMGIKEKYDKLAAEESQSLKNYHSHEIEFLLKEIAHLRVDLQTREEKIDLQDKQFAKVKQSYERQLGERITQINNLNKSLLTIEDSKNKEIKDLANKRELQRSRTSGVISSRKENTQFMDKQLRKLNEQVLDKTIKIENLSRDLGKQKKRSEEVEKNFTIKIENLITQRQEQNKQRQEHFARIEDSLKKQIIELNSKELKLLGQVDSFKSQIDVLKNELRRHEEIIKSKENEIREFKNMLEKLREDHAKEINNLMKQRKRRSSNLGSSRSLSSSLKESGMMEDSPQITTKRMESVGLPTVREESPQKNISQSLQRSNITEEINIEEDQNELAKVAYHYDALIEELKKSHASQIQLLRHKVDKSAQILEQKQQELLDILTRFSPLVKIHAGEKSVEQDRKERIERHWKADLGLLQIILERYKIKVFE